MTTFLSEFFLHSLKTEPIDPVREKFHVYRVSASKVDKRYVYMVHPLIVAVLPYSDHMISVIAFLPKIEVALRMRILVRARSCPFYRELAR